MFLISCRRERGLILGALVAIVMGRTCCKTTLLHCRAQVQLQDLHRFYSPSVCHRHVHSSSVILPIVILWHVGILKSLLRHTTSPRLNAIILVLTLIITKMSTTNVLPKYEGVILAVFFRDIFCTAQKSFITSHNFPSCEDRGHLYLCVWSLLDMKSIAKGCKSLVICTLSFSAEREALSLELS